MSRYYQPIRISHRLFEAASGSCKKPPFILMHGLMENKEVWENISQGIADATRRKVYTYDARNHGESEHTMDSSFDHNLSDLYHFMDKMDIHESVLVGHNMGGMTAIKAALQQPNRIETAFIVDMHIGNMPYERVVQYAVYMKTLVLNLHFAPDDIPKPNLALVRYPPPFEKLQRMEYLKRSVLAFRCLALMDALRLYESSQRTVLTGDYLEPIYFIYGSRSKYFVEDRKGDIVDLVLRYFPHAQFETFCGPTSRAVFAAPGAFVKYIARKIPPPKDSY